MKGRDNRAAIAPAPQGLNTTPDTNKTSHPANALPLQSPRLLTREQAACYCGVTPDTFDDYRRRAIVPDPIDGTNRWDRKLIDLWLDRASGIASGTTTSLDEWRARRNG
jgi:hypothetical protein